MGGSNPLSDLIKYARYFRGWEIAKRYFAIELFDTTLIVISVMVSSMVFNLRDIRAVSGIFVNISIAGVMAGITIVFLVESVEREKELKEMERALLTDLNGTVLQKSMVASIVLSTLMQVLGVVLPTSIPLIIFQLMGVDIVSDLAVIVIIGVEMLLLFSIGFILGGNMKKAVMVGFLSVALGVILTLIGVTLTPAL